MAACLSGLADGKNLILDSGPLKGHMPAAIAQSAGVKVANCHSLLTRLTNGKFKSQGSRTLIWSSLIWAR